MGAHILAICQRRIDGKWRHMLNIPCSPVRVEWLNYVHYDFLIYTGHHLSGGGVEFVRPESDYCIAHARGYPEDFDAEQAYVTKFWDPVTNDNPEVDIPWPDQQGSWVTIDELVNHDYDRTVTRHGETKPLREFLGEEFIQFWRDAKAKGAERMVFCID